MIKKVLSYSLLLIIISCKAQNGKVFSYQTEIDRIVNQLLKNNKIKSHNKEVLLVLNTIESTKDFFIKKDKNFDELFENDSLLFSNENVKNYINQLSTNFNVNKSNCSNLKDIFIYKVGVDDEKDFESKALLAYRYMISKPIFSLDNNYVIINYYEGSQGGWLILKRTANDWEEYKYLLSYIE